MTPGPFRPAWAEVDVSAIVHNTSVLRDLIGPSALCAVVKADGYGHGAVIAARAAVAGGAVALAVALVEEGVQLRDARIDDPVLLLCEPPSVDAAEELAARHLEATVCTTEGVARTLEGARRAGARVPVHVKVDTGMHRIGASPVTVADVVDAVSSAGPALELAGVWTHLAVADGSSPEDRDFTLEQLRRFDGVLATLAARGHRPPLVHAANSAGTIAYPAARYRACRCGIALYGETPSVAVADALGRAFPDVSLKPAMTLKARVSAVRVLDAGARPSYGRCRPLPEPSLVATVPLGYADGVPRALFDAGFEVLIGGRRRPLAGSVTMDQIVVDCGAQDPVAIGDEVVLLGRQGGEEIGAGEWAAKLGTISYEVLSRIGARVPRVAVGTIPADRGGRPVDARGRTESAGRSWARWIREARLR